LAGKSLPIPWNNENATTEINEALKMNPEGVSAKLVQGQPAAKLSEEEALPFPPMERSAA